ncbi:MAG: hypothetical protein J6Z14_08535 [Prevotella sp.]|nr:hypothetical protein [Prevotella sp.]
MKKTLRLLTMVSLAVAGTLMAGCSGSDDIIDNPQPPTAKDNVVTVTTTVSLAGGGEEGGGKEGGEATTRALNPATGVKTFAKDDQIAITYYSIGEGRVTTISDPITDIRDGGKRAGITVTLTNPGAGTVSYVYPAAANEDPNFFRNNQDGTLETLQSTFDYCSGFGDMIVRNEGIVTLPAVELENSMAILAITLKDADGSHTITSSLNEVVIDFGSNSANYTIRPKSGSTTFGQDVIYVAMSPTNLSFTVNAAFPGGDRYTKTPTQRHYYSGNIYNLGWRMTQTGYDLSNLTHDVTLQDGNIAKGTLAGNYKVSIADGATVTLDGVTKVKATKGTDADHSIGNGSNQSTCGTVTIGGVEGAISDSPYSYEPISLRAQPFPSH